MVWSLFYEYLRRRQEKLAASSAENDAWSNVDLPSVKITSSRGSSSPTGRQQNHRTQQIQRHNSGGAAYSESSNNTSQSTTSLPRLPMLYSLARNWAFPAVAFRCQTNPEEASAVWMDEQGDNALHWVVFGNPPVHVVEELLRACPNLARRRNKQRTLPLHGTIIRFVFNIFLS
jgi:hypothetical protein